jgi:predicted permease
LVVVEMALALLLLIGATLLIRSFVGLRSVDSGFDPHNVFTFQTSLAGGAYSTTASVTAFTTQVVRRVEMLPGVEAAASTIVLPVEGGIDLPFAIIGKPPERGEYNGDEQWRSVSPHYFQVFRIPLLRGRVFTETDTGASARVVIINDAMAKKFWPNADPIGQQLTIGKGLGPEFEEPAREIVGVVGNVRQEGLQNGDSPAIYVPFAQMPVRGMYVMARTRVPPETVAEPARRAVQTIDRDLPVTEVGTFEQHIELSRLDLRLFSRVFLVFGAIALLLACTGLYAVVAHIVAQRRAEIGVRLAIGANPGHILRLIVTSGMGQIAVGLVLGVLASLVLMRTMRAIITGVSTADPITLVAVVVLLGGAGLLGCVVPAYRALRVDPVTTLRAQ